MSDCYNLLFKTVLIMCTVKFNTLLGKAIPGCWEFVLVLNRLTMGILTVATMVVTMMYAHKLIISVIIWRQY